MEEMLDFEQNTTYSNIQGNTTYLSGVGPVALIFNDNNPGFFMGRNALINETTGDKIIPFPIIKPPVWDGNLHVNSSQAPDTASKPPAWTTSHEEKISRDAFGDSNEGIATLLHCVSRERMRFPTKPPKSPEKDAYPLENISSTQTKSFKPESSEGQCNSDDQATSLTQEMKRNWLFF
ncbi:uncharacterized protein [Pocillopora verrucosa]|uniref:uncharacterized protein isoform X2 n=1 Tax=Pocillopora verrucosa TaxID=203993 RepID=UPI00333FB614